METLMTRADQQYTNRSSKEQTPIYGGRMFVGRPLSLWAGSTRRPERCALYARPTAMAGPVVQQIAASRAIADENGWDVDERHVLGSGPKDHGQVEQVLSFL